MAYAPTMDTDLPAVRLPAAPVPGQASLLTPGALSFLTQLHRRFEPARQARLIARRIRAARFDEGELPDFRADTAHIRDDPSWRVAGAGPGLEDRRVEITGPTDPKMTINALNSGARVWLADQEDATSPTWRNVIGGQLSLFDAIRGQLSFTSPEGKRYEVTAERTPTIVMRPRGWHLPEKHVTFIDRAGRELAASGSLVDYGLYVFHNFCYGIKGRLVGRLSWLEVVPGPVIAFAATVMLGVLSWHLFEGPLNAQHRRNTSAGWRHDGLPWEQC